jgi:hypothetical protein
MQALFYKLLYIFLLLLTKSFQNASRPAFSGAYDARFNCSGLTVVCAVSLLSTYMYPISMASLPTGIPILTGIFSMVCSFIGYAKQRPVRTTVMRCNGNADAGRQLMKAVRAYRQGLQIMTNPMRIIFSCILSADMRQEDNKLITTDAADVINFSIQFVTHDTYRSAQCFVTGLMPEDIVNLFKIIQIQKE